MAIMSFKENLQASREAGKYSLLARLMYPAVYQGSATK